MPTNSPALMIPIPTSTNGAGLPFSAQVTTKQQVKGAAGSIFGWSILNTTSAIAYVQVFNALAANVTLGSTSAENSPISSPAALTSGVSVVSAINNPTGAGVQIGTANPLGVSVVSAINNPTATAGGTWTCQSMMVGMG